MASKKSEITQVEIGRAENGFVYKVCVDLGDGMDWHEYVYESVDEVLKALKEDLESPHYRDLPEEKDEPKEAENPKTSKGDH